MTASPAPTPMNVSSTAKIRMEMRAHPRRRKIAMAVQIPQPLKRANIEAIAIPIAAMENGGAAGPLGGGASVMPNSIKPPNTRVARLPAMARPPLARIPIHFLAMIADQCTGLSARGPGGSFPVARSPGSERLRLLHIAISGRCACCVWADRFRRRCLWNPRRQQVAADNHGDVLGAFARGIAVTCPCMPDYVWRPIEPLSDVERRVDLGAIAPLYESWRASKKRIQQSSQAKLSDFNQRLIRRLSVETGILERLYDLDRGTTEALIAHGFAEELVTRSNTNIEPSRLIDLLRDQEAAIQLVIDCVARSRDISKGLIHELHAILTRHQETTTAVDQFGKRFEISLLKGTYKEQPNNPKRPDNTIHEYCPPVHVDAEMDSLLGWLTAYVDYDPIIVASWLHHRFTQIHPYQDGNGRVARALTTMILLRADLLPLVVDRDLRVEYIGALEAADMGSLAELASIFARLERTAILQALSVDADADIARQQSLTSAVIGSLADKFSRRREHKLAELRHVNVVAIALRERAETSVAASLNELTKTVTEQIGRA